MKAYQVINYITKLAATNKKDIKTIGLVIGGCLLGTYIIQGIANTWTNVVDKDISNITSICEVDSKDNEWVRLAGIYNQEDRTISDNSGCTTSVPYNLKFGNTGDAREFTAFVKKGTITEVDNIFESFDIVREGTIEETISIQIKFNPKDVKGDNRYQFARVIVPQESGDDSICPGYHMDWNDDTRRWDNMCELTLRIPNDLYNNMSRGRYYELEYGLESNMVRSINPI